MSDPKQNENQPDQPKQPSQKMVKVKVLRPFRLKAAGKKGVHEGVVYDRIGAIVEVPATEVGWLTQSVPGQSAGFGERLDEEATRHDCRRAMLVEGSVAA